MDMLLAATSCSLENAVHFTPQAAYLGNPTWSAWASAGMTFLLVLATCTLAIITLLLALATLWLRCEAARSSRATESMAREMQEQFRFIHRPILILRIEKDPEGSGSKGLSITNTGNGYAKNAKLRLRDGVELEDLSALPIEVNSRLWFPCDRLMRYLEEHAQENRIPVELVYTDAFECEHVQVGSFRPDLPQFVPGDWSDRRH